jgi:dihydroorotate dehydrogenase (NAD+) catalytic subunit
VTDKSSLQELDLRSPWLNAAGFLGFAPPTRKAEADTALLGAARQREFPLGAFITNPISAGRRTPAEGRVFLPFEGGFLLHTGLPNPGLSHVLAEDAQRWKRSPVPIWVHLIGDAPQDIDRMVRKLEDREYISTIELGISPKAAPELALDLVRAAVGELPVVVSIPLERINEEWLDKLPALGVRAVSLSAPYGTLPGREARLVSGRIYGPAIFPLALNAVRALKRLGLPVIAAGGVFRKKDGEAMLAAGALAVQLDAVLWQ